MLPEHVEMLWLGLGLVVGARSVLYLPGQDFIMVVIAIM